MMVDKPRITLVQGEDGTSDISDGLMLFTALCVRADKGGEFEVDDCLFVTNTGTNIYGKLVVTDVGTDSPKMSFRPVAVKVDDDAVSE